MKKTACAFVFILSLYANALAHPPSDIKISYEPATGILQAIVVHNVSTPDSHYIKKVDIGLNGKEIAELKFFRQDNDLAQPVSYAVPNAKPGDTISVEAYCSISGTLTKEIKVQ